MSTFKFAAQPLSIAKLYEQGFSLYKSTFSKIWYLLFINIAIIGILQIFTYSLVPMDKAKMAASAWMLTPPSSTSSITPNAATAPSGAATPTVATAQSGAVAATPTAVVAPSGEAMVSAAGLSELQTLIFSVANFIGLLIAVYFVGVILCRMYILGDGSGAANIGNSFQTVLRKWFKLVVLMIVVLLLVLLGMIVFVLPGLFLGTLLAFSMPILLFEGKGVWRSIIASCMLVWGHFWRSSIVLVPVGIVLLLGVVIQHLGYKYTNSLLVTNVIFSVFLVLFGALIYAFLLVQYNDLKLRKQTAMQQKLPQ